MRKFLSIVIPRFREAERDIFPLLASISGQVGVDFSDIETVISNDGGSTPLDENFLGLFNMEIRQVFLENNGGPGAARQNGLDAAVGQYVMFCDADDTLHNVGILGAVMQEAEKTAADILATSWLEELRDLEGHCSYIPHEQENTWMHGKLFRRAFLTENNIRFHPDLRVHEDSYFLSVASAAAHNSRYLPVTSYVWKFNPNSITRRNGGVYTYDSIPVFIEAVTASFKVVEQIAPAQMGYKVVQFVLYNYFQFHWAGWQAAETAGYLRAAEEAFVRYMGPFWHYWAGADPRFIAELYNQERQKSFAGGVESETVGAWIQRLGMTSNPT